MKKNENWRLLRRQLHKPLLVMKLILMLIVFSGIQLSAKVYSQNTKLSFDLKNYSLIEVFKEIRNNTEFTFVYDIEDVNQIDKLNLNYQETSVEDILKDCLKGSGLTWEVNDDVIIIKPVKQEVKQKIIIIKGKVKDDRGVTIPGVNIVASKYKIGTITDINGNYKIRVPDDTPNLVFTFVGFEKKTVAIKGRTDINVRMKTKVNEIDDVVITGLGLRARESYTGAATLITKEELKAFEGRDLIETLGNIDPSVNLVENNEWGSDPNRLPEIEIRGISSLPQLDGVKIDTESGLSTPLIILDGFESTLQRMMDLEQDEVQSITILKDAGATAIYGSRGANGVIVITLIPPKMGRLQVNYRSQLNLEVPDLTSYDLLNASEKLQVEKEAGIYTSKQQTASEQLALDRLYASRLQEVKRGVNTDWLAQPLQMGVGQRHTLSLGGGDTAFRYSLTGSYNNVVSVMKGSDRTNFNGGINLVYNQKTWRISNNFSLGLNNSSNTPYGTFSNYAKLNPYWTPYDDDGDLKKRLEGTEVNPLYNAKCGIVNTSDYLQLTNNTRIELDVATGLRMSGAISISNKINNGDLYYPATHTKFDSYSGNMQFKKGSYNYSTGKSRTYTLRYSLNYNRTFAEKHSITFGFNADLSESSSQSYGVQALGFVHERFTFFGSGLAYPSEEDDGRPSGSEATSRRVGFTGSLNYAYDNRYYADFSYRSDGSSMFGEDTRFAPFWSVGVGWNIWREKFIEDLNLFSNLRLKGSYGVTGTQNFPEYQSYTTYMYSTSEAYGSLLGAGLLGIGNSNLKWQQTKQYNLGLEMGFLNNRLRFNADVYLKRTDNLIAAIELPMSNGFPNYQGNKGSLKNEGIDIRATFYIIRDNKSGINWSITASMGSNKNTIVSISEEMKRYNKEIAKQENPDPALMYEEGSSLRTLWAVKSLGIDPSNGREIYVKKDGSLTYKWYAGDKTDCGITSAPYRGSINTRFRYKRFNINMSMGYRFGGQKYNSTLVNKVENADVKYNVDRRVYEDRWKKPGDDVLFKGLKNSTRTNVTSRFVQDDNTFIANSINVGYSVSGKKWLDKIKIRSLSISANTNQLFQISSIKMERGTSFPFSRRMSLSLSARF